MRITSCLFAIALLGAQSGWAQGKTALVRTSDGELEGVVEASGIRSFKGVPYAQPPVGALRFREPQPVLPWKGVRKANAFGPRAMQLPIYSDMQFRSNGVSEDCLYLNIWTPAGAASKQLPVLVYFYGGGFVAGDGSEYRYDGESMARRGMVAVTVNYRLGVFGSLAHPDLTRESPHHSSGNYGLLDQHAALVWVQQHIVDFGGDPSQVTIAGESAGSNSVSAQMASPLSKGLFRGVIGESGSVLGNRMASLADGEKAGLAFAAGLGNKSLADLRAMPAQDLLTATAKGVHFPFVVDGYFFPESPVDIFAAGKQQSVALLAGWNSAEQNFTGVLGNDSPTVANYEKAVRRLGGDKSDSILALYKATTVAEVERAATDLATDHFIAFSTWKWIDMHTRTGGKPVYRYLYAHPRPAEVGAPANAWASKLLTMGAGHSWEIEYALGNLSTNKVYAWAPEDLAVSETMQNFFANFIKTGDPNGKGLPSWQPMQTVNSSIMVIDVSSHAETEPHAERYRFLDSLH